jgi:hypothetical protein
MSDTETETTDTEPAEGFTAPLGAGEPSDDDLAEEADETPEEPTDGQESASMERVATAEELEAQRAKLQRSATNWRNRVSDVLGEDAQHLVPCELCEPDIPGFHFPAEMMIPETELDARLIAALIGSDGPDYPEASDVSRCETCAGYGNVRTGSRVAGRETKTCSTCVGYGYVPPPSLDRNGPAPAGQAPELVAVGASPGLMDDHDAWNSPRLLPDGRENPNYGKMPQYKDAALP